MPSESTIKKQRKQIRKLVEALLANMNLWDRLKFVFTGDHYKPLQRTYGNLKEAQGKLGKPKKGNLKGTSRRIHAY